MPINYRGNLPPPDQVIERLFPDGDPAARQELILLIDNMQKIIREMADEIENSGNDDLIGSTVTIAGIKFIADPSVGVRDVVIGGQQSAGASGIFVDSSLNGGILLLRQFSTSIDQNVLNGLTLGAFVDVFNKRPASSGDGILRNRWANQVRAEIVSQFNRTTTLAQAGFTGTTDTRGIFRLFAQRGTLAKGTP